MKGSLIIVSYFRKQIGKKAEFFFKKANKRYPNELEKQAESWMGEEVRGSRRR